MGVTKQMREEEHGVWLPSCETELAGAAMALGARNVEGWSDQEKSLAAKLRTVGGATSAALRRLISDGGDPLGERFCELRTPIERRDSGATYTPHLIVKLMVDWARDLGHNPRRVVDPGTGSARFLVEAGRAFPDAQLLGIEIDPLAAMIARGNLAASGMSDRSRILVADFREVEIEHCESTLFIGNPPYVRHHQLAPAWKGWLTETASSMGLTASQLAGLHVHFFLATVIHGQPGDCGALITSAEWLDVNYGRLVRDLFVGALGGRSILVIEPTAMPFPDTATTAAITTFKLHSKPRSVFFSRVQRLDEVEALEKGRRIRRGRLSSERRWSHLTRIQPEMPDGFIELGELFRAHRGQVTGANKVWIAGEHSKGLPESVLFPSVTRAKELFDAGQILENTAHLRRVIDLPVELSELDSSERKRVRAFLKKARSMGAHKSYTARNRRAWWSVGLREPAPILATYMARRPPAFVRNLGQAHHINIAHGLYPREPLAEAKLLALVRYLATFRTTSLGRTYAGGLVKFEPREMERIPIPSPDVLEAQMDGDWL